MAKSYQLIQSQTLTSATTFVTFSNIPQNFTSLLLKVSARTVASSNFPDLYLTFNSSSTGYASRYFYGSGATTVTAISGVTTSILAGSVVGASQTSSTFSNNDIYIPNYTGSNYKAISMESTVETNATTAYIVVGGGTWSNAAAITTVLCFSSANFDVGSTFYLYGIGATRATGGTITSDANYTYHTFTSTGSFTPLEQIKNAEVLLIAGGGGGGGCRGGGGGAGGVLYTSGQTLTAGTSYTALIGSGGAGGEGPSSGGNNGVSGTNSTFASLVGVGGGFGQGNNGTTNGSGGSSGGGVLWGTSPVGTAIVGQGNLGGLNTVGYTISGQGGGGGGAGGVGTSIGAAGVPGNGGVGTTAYNYWGAATNTGGLFGGAYYYGGGGGGASDGNYPAGTGGTGGGGAGGQVAVGTAGTANTGGGGGGGGRNSTSGAAYSGGAGGSGLVIVRYPNT